MKKFTLFFFMSLLTLCSYAQGIDPAEGFEGTTFPPTGWTRHNNGIGMSQQWKQTLDDPSYPFPPNLGGSFAAIIDRENVPDDGDPAKDWLVTLPFEMPANGQLRFWSRLTLNGNQGTIYKILMAPAGADLTDLASFTVIQTYTEALINPVQQEYNEIVLSLPGTVGQNYHVAFLMEGDFQDRWLIDDVSIVEQCLPPTDLTATDVTDTSATLSWTGAAAQYEIEVMPVTDAPDGSGDIVDGNSTTVSPLLPTTPYKYYVRSVCGTGNTSDWAGPYSFNTSPGNDECADATVLTVNPTNICTVTTPGTINGGSASAETTTCTGTPNDDVWFTFVATNTSHIIDLINITGGTTNLVHVVYEGTSCGTMTQLYCSDPNTSTATGLTVGNTYYVRVYSWTSAANQTTAFDVCLGTPPPPPANDECATATSVPVNSDLSCAQFVTATIYSATGSAEANTCTGVDDDDVWFSFEATSTSHTINLNNITSGTTALDHVLYSGSCGVLNLVYCSNPNNSIAGGLTIGDTYYVRVYSTASTPQTSVFDICIGTPPPPPVNDDCSTAISVTVNPDLECGSVTPGTIAWATPSMDANACTGGADDDVWYTFVATNPTHTINVNNITGGTTLLYHSIYTGTCGSLTNISCSTTNSSLVGLNVGQTYYVRIYSSTTAAGQTSVFDLCIGTPPDAPVNDECADATVVVPNPDLECTNFVSGTIAWSSGSAEPNTCFGTDDDDVWYQFVATSTSHTVNLNNVAGSYTFMYHTVYEGTSCGSMTQLYCNTNSSSIAGGLTIGQTYYVRIYTSTSIGMQDTTFDFCVGTPPPPPANDECADATVVVPNADLECGTVASGTIAWATGSAETNACYGTDDDDVWYQFVATNEIHTININVTGSSTTLYNVVYEGTTCGALTQLNCTTSTSPILMNLTVGQTYYVRIYSSTSLAPQLTTFDLCIGTPPPPPVNDECANAIEVPVNTTPTCDQVVAGTISWSTGSTQGSTCSGTEDDDTWFEFTATNETHVISISNIVGNLTVLYYVVYEGDDCDALTQLYCANGMSFATGLTVGTTYKIRVYSYTSLPGQLADFDICVTTPPPAPANDECADAIVAPVNPDQFCGETVSGTIYSATASAEANTCFGSDDDDVWFEFVATNTTHIISLSNITPSNSFYHTVYEGDECGTLTQLYCNSTTQSFATGLTIGNTYKVRLYTSSSLPQTSSFDLCIGTPPPPPANDECAEATVIIANASSECVESGSGTIFSATASTEGNTCTGVADDDVWFEFTAVNTTHFITINNIQGSTAGLYHVLYEGDECGTLTQLYCSTSAQSLAENLTVGNIYKVRVYSSTSTPNQTSTFNICIATPAGSITVNETLFNAEQLVETVLIGSECAIVSNITSQSGSDFGGAGSIGYFNFNNSSFPFNDGVILATGSINEAPGPYPNNSGGITGSGWGSDADLAEIIAEEGNTDPLYNASVLEFDFVPLTNQITFDFLFASNEYGTFQCSYGDAFAFILTDLEDENAVPVNLAVLPGTTVPVSVVNIRNGAYNANCESVNEQYFGSFNQTNPYGSAIAYRGQTVVLTAAGDVIPGNQYHIKLVIADYRDQSFNSAVFLAGGSFDIGGLDLGLDLTVIDGTAICDNEESVIETGLSEDDYDFVWYTVDGDIATVIENETGASLTVSETNDYRVVATYTGSTCSLEGNKRVEFYVPVEETVGVPVDLIGCDASGFTTFDFASNTALIEAGVIEGYDVADFVISYHASEADAQNDANPIGSVYENTVAELQTIYVRVEYMPTGCVGMLNFNLIVQDLTPDFDMGGDFNICEGTTGVTIDLVANNYDPASPDVTYSWTYNGDALPDTGSSVTVTGEGTYEVTVNNSGCEATQSVFVTVTPIPVADVMEDVVACDSYVLPALSPNNFYHTPEGETLAAGTEITTDQMIYIYTESGTAPANCTDESSFMVSLVATPLIEVTGGCIGGRYTMEVILDDEYYTEETVLIEWTDPNGAIISTDITAIAEEIGDYVVTVTPAGGDICSSVLVYNVENAACTIPRGISPNGDNMNDNFDLSGLGVIKLSIFNRYGKEVYSKTDYSDEWYGLDKHGKELPTGTYFYSLELNDGTSKTGWVYINREN
ncbi:T9SS type B sorting domain-containing protein [Flavobacterium alkalisoli]|uniref:T9SS type B sorting domain-containing protein n=1 Tax=Flavobacterium alkalisoli TaxID=2602769 RepID=A0A5B9FS21_9FLAO|nr:choice-of-anchor L domain-containing protein [Flavobacterium alkalisoli]QEE49810.1 T9SS type B sorting domain-containing protein [Flavobacterium alkalisoli]